ERGLVLDTDVEGELHCRPSLANDDIVALPPPDLCLICVKEFDLAHVLVALKPLVHDNTITLPLLNGMDVHARVRKVINRGIVLPACVYVGTHIESPGVVKQRGGACKILLGSDPGRADFDPAELLQLFADSKIKCEWTPDVQKEIWTKFIFICAYGTVTAAYDKTVGEVFENETLRAEVADVMHECVAIANAVGVPLPNDIIEASLAKAKNFPFETRTSFQRDFERPHKPDERNLFAGAVIQRAEEFGLDVPKTRSLFALLNQRKPSSL
ncbi:MAG: ketopantoate reductase family protein, partial [Limisphaerales bacterium]